MKVVNVPLYTGRECENLQDHESISSDFQVCAGFNGSGPGQSDSGGPLQCRSHYNHSNDYKCSSSNGWMVIGITSYSIDECGSSEPSVFTNEAAFLPWIKMIVSNKNHDYIYKR